MGPSKPFPIFTGLISLIALFDGLLIGFYDEMSHQDRFFSPLLLPDVVKTGNLTKLLASNFHHLNGGHLLGNICLFLLLGIFVEREIGFVKMAILVWTTCLFSDLFSVFLTPHSAGTLGMSAICYGLLGASGVLLVRIRAKRGFVLKLCLFVMLLAFLGTLEWHSLVLSAQFDQFAHLFGLLTGIGCGFALSRSEENQKFSKPYLGVSFVPFLVIFVAWLGFFWRSELSAVPVTSFQSEGMSFDLPLGMRRESDSNVWSGLSSFEITVRDDGNLEKFKELPDASTLVVEDKTWVYKSYPRHTAFAANFPNGSVVVKLGRSGASVERDLEWAKEILKTVVTTKKP